MADYTRTTIKLPQEVALDLAKFDRVESKGLNVHKSPEIVPPEYRSLGAGRSKRRKIFQCPSLVCMLNFVMLYIIYPTV